MKKILSLTFLVISIISFSAQNIIKDEMEIYSMRLSEVLLNLSKLSNKTILADSSVKDNLIDVYFPAGTSLEKALEVIAKGNNLNISFQDNNIILSEKNIDASSKKIIGKVVDYYTGKVIKNAKVHIKGDYNKIENTDASGTFIFTNVPSDVYLINIFAKGYESKGEIISVEKDKKFNNLVVRLKAKRSYDKEWNLDLFYETCEEKIDEEAEIINLGNKILYSKNFNLESISAEEIKKILLDLYGDQIKISFNEGTNNLVVIADKEILFNVAKSIKEFDKRSKQIQIKSEIVDVSNNMFEELGFDWAFGTNENKQKNSSFLNFLGTATNIAGNSLFGSSFNLVRQFSDSNTVLNFGIKCLESTNDLEITSVPNITMESGKFGEFKVSEELVVGQKVHRKKINKEIVNVVEPAYKEAGIILKVRPITTDGEYIILDINLEVSDFKYRQTDSSRKNENNNFSGSKIGRNIKTRVRVKDGETLLIGGLKKSLKHNSESKVPVLGDIPLLGNLFKNSSVRNETSNMYIKITAEVLD